MSRSINAGLKDSRQLALDWLFGRINYERSTSIPYSEQGLKLEGMRELLRRLGDPQSKLKIIHIAGTKGKGSTGAMIAAGIQQAGLRVGVYSSPHLERFEERIAINGEPCSADELVGLIEQVRPVAEAMDLTEGGGPTFFDLSTALAILHFSQSKVDAVVLEVGLGGRLDSTNVCTPVVSVITSISRDHVEQLGETLSKIAFEKAGIIKQGVPVVSGVIAPEPAEVIEKQANVRQAPYFVRGKDFDVRPTAPRTWSFKLATEAETVELPEIRPAMHGAAQAENGAVALATIGVLRSLGWAISWKAATEGIAMARLPARMERFDAVLGTDLGTGRPTVVLDGAHNEAAAQALASALPEIAPDATDRTLLLSIAEDKEVANVVASLIPLFDRVIVTQFIENPRAMAPERLAQLVAEHLTDKKPTIQVVSTPADAWCSAVRGTDPSGVIVVAGSFFLAAEVRRLIIAERQS